MSLAADYNEILAAASHLPVEQRAALAQALIDTLRPSSRPKPTIDQLVGVGRGDGPPPTDEQVRRWIDEHRTEKYGGR